MFLLTFIFSCIGVVCRYFFEYGGYLVEMSFTTSKIIVFLTFTTLYCGVVY